MRKIVILCVLCFGFALAASAQSDKLAEKAGVLVEKLNKDIASVNQSLALTNNQKYQIKDIHIGRLKALRVAKKEGFNKEKNQEINKKYYQQIFGNVLTKEQKKVLRELKGKVTK
ncbi:hypothetical protein [Snuella sedimenti]|uniref:DUF4168 domain-containing protein n=1 Tax=Snuella sedimenti TaxID=2798802 RepID=A0A8J7IWQ4_9FLAO|nr:hypothetical protein [Snuella sedimenti]MBJ6368515.1 hypothetical protein [Snuella sedimenti]